MRGLCLIGLVLAMGLDVAPSDTLAATAADDSFVSLPGLGPGAVLASDQEVPIEETYRRQCAACHGEQGRGDGRMARRFKPPPADFRDPEGVPRLTDEELVDVIIEGRASMPAFGDVLNEEVVTVLVTYVRELSRGVER